MSFVRSLALGTALAGFTLLLGLSGSAGASLPDSLQDCTSLGQSIVKPGGAIQAVGTTRASVPGEGCYSSNTYLSPVSRFLVQLQSDGTPDPSFSDGGVKFLDVAAPIELMSAGGGQSILATENSLLKFNADGSPVASFGDGGTGHLPSQIGGLPIIAAAIQPDGKVVVAVGDIYSGPFLVRFDQNGAPDVSFGGDGFVDPTLPDPGEGLGSVAGIGFDGLGRIVAVGNGMGGYGAAAVRLLPDGSPDPDFGANHNGFSDPWDSTDGVGGVITEMAVDADGAIRAYGAYNAIYQHWNVAYSFDADGLADGPGRDIGAEGSGIFADIPGGGVATTVYPQRGDFHALFNVARLAPAGSPFPGFGGTTFEPSPGASGVHGLTYAPDGDSLIAIGSAGAFQCRETTCTDQRLGVVAKVNAKTGTPDSGFGVGGVTLVPHNECTHGSIPPKATEIPGGWRRCRVTPPVVKAKLRFAHGRSSKPSLSGTVKVLRPQAKPEFLERNVAVQLPKRLKLRGKARKKLFVNVVGAGQAAVKTSLSGRTISVRVVPDSTGFDPYDYLSYAPSNGPVRIGFNLKRGALKTVPERLRRSSLVFRVGATYSPSKSQYEEFGPPDKWFGPNSTSTTVRARPVKQRKRS